MFTSKMQVPTHSDYASVYYDLARVAAPNKVVARRTSVRDRARVLAVAVEDDAVGAWRTF